MYKIFCVVHVTLLFRFSQTSYKECAMRPRAPKGGLRTKGSGTKLACNFSILISCNMIKIVHKCACTISAFYKTLPLTLLKI